jgi:flagellin
MGFRINNNIDALVANGHMVRSQMGISKSIERLSSGLRINRGADDAAGLTISEKIRGQIRGLNRAIGNSQDGISLIQTAEGALNEDASILNRLRELSIQSQADSLTSNDRLEIQKEVDQMVSEIDRISQTTEFNTKTLLDGTANALVSTDNNDLKAFQKGGAGRLSAGDYKIDVRQQDVGEKQVQQGGILKHKTTGNLAALSTKLVDLESFFDNDGNDILENTQTITLRGNGAKIDVTVSSDLTLEQFTANMEDAITKSKEDGGLELKGSTFAFHAQSGQIIFESGTAGQTGEVSLAMSEDMNRALGMQITTDSVAAAYTVVSTQVGVATPEVVSANTTSDRATGVVEGLDLQFALSSEARIDGSVAGSDAITINDFNGSAAGGDAVFTFHDTNGAYGSGDRQAATSMTAGVTVTLTRSRTYTLASISTMVNNAIQVSNDTTDVLTLGKPTSANFQVPGITASFDGYNLKLTSNIGGSSGEISILANQGAIDNLGVQSGKIVGSGGTAAVLTGGLDISDGITFSGTGVRVFRVSDGDFNMNGVKGVNTNDSLTVANGGDIAFTEGVAISSTSVVDTFNNYFATNDVEAAATLTADGKLEIRSTETGGDSKISIFGGTSGSASGLTTSLAEIGFINNQNDIGSSDGNSAVFNGNTNEATKDVAYTMTDALTFAVTDKRGISTNSITFVTANVSSTGESFSISQSSITGIINNSNLGTTDVDFKFDAGNRLDFFSRSSGEEARIALSTGNSSAQETIGRTTFGIDFGQAVQGEGTLDFDLHVADRSLTFQIGANKSQHLNFEVINTSAESLGLEDLDITNIKSATRALGTIDDAIQIISSERSKLGSLQNRLTSTMANLTVTSTNLSSFESQIRDVDLAKETVEFTRNQILVQAGTAQLAQAKALPQGAMQLLG